MPLDFYYHPFSPPCRSVMLTAKAVGVELNLKKIDIMKGEHMSPDFIAINPQHSVPTLVDGNVKLWESRAICSYLASQYGKDDSLYPNNPRARCIVDARLYFDMGTLYQRWTEYGLPVAFFGAKPDPQKLERIHEALGWLNTYLTEYNFAAGNKITVADCCLVATVSSLEAAGIELEQYSRITRWLKRCKTSMVGYAQANGEGAMMFGGFMKSKLNPEEMEKAGENA